LFAPESETENLADQDPVSLGSQILKAVLDFDELAIAKGSVTRAEVEGVRVCPNQRRRKRGCAATLPIRLLDLGLMTVADVETVFQDLFQGGRERHAG